MIDRVRDLLEELRDNWNDHYWWARHQALQVALLGLLAGALNLLFVWLGERVKQAAARGTETP